MKLIKTANGKKTIKMSKSEWESIGRTAGWMSNTDFIEISPTPVGEECVQVGQDNYNALNRIETRAFVRQLERMFPNRPEGVVFKTKGYPHDFGTYHEVVAQYPVDDEAAESFAMEVQNQAPKKWDEEARAELEKQGYFERLEGKEPSRPIESPILNPAEQMLKDLGESEEDIALMMEDMDV